MAQEVHKVACNNCGQRMDVTGVPALSQVQCPTCGHLNVVPIMIAHFQLFSMIGQGGMGSVYRAYDTALQRIVAVKLLKKELSAQQDFITNFAREARATAVINHQNIVQVYSFGEEDNQYYLVMEVVDKGSLDERLEREGHIPELEVLEIGAQIAAGLRAAQQQNLLHRDIKPGNILFGDHGMAKLVDFGLAAFGSDGEEAEIWGTPYYIAPEKLSGGREDFRSDIYSLGGTLFHAIAGRPPFDADSASEIVAKHMKSQAVSLQAFAPETSSETAYVINRMLHKNPFERYNSYDELIQHLQYAKQQIEERLKNPQAARMASKVIVKPAESSPVVMWTVLSLLVLLLGGGIYFGLNHKKILSRFENRGKPVVVEDVVETNPVVKEHWERGNDQFISGQFPDALSEYEMAEKAIKLGEKIPFERWLFFQKLAASYADRMPIEQVKALYDSAGVNDGSALPTRVNTESFKKDMAASIFVKRKSGDEDTYWAGQSKDVRKMGYFYVAMRELSVDNYERTRRLLNQFKDAESSQQWMTGFNKFAEKMLKDMDKFEKSTQLANEAYSSDPVKALSIVQDALSSITYPAFVEKLQVLEAQVKPDADAKKAAQTPSTTPEPEPATP
ncbi:MAG: serine/threonine-protein kinase [Verrucomicrobiota bacterium]|nr:serine/threonine-protein kinase [Verrucomicrobiota bacterium]